MARRSRNEQPPAEWDFFSFPVYFGFVLGALFGIILPLFLGQYSLTLVVLGLSFGVSHLIFQGMRRRRVDAKRQAEEEAERERRALAARRAASLQNEAASVRRRRRRRRPSDSNPGSTRAPDSEA